MGNIWVDRKQIKEKALKLIVKLYRYDATSPYGMEFLDYTAKPIACTLTWTMEEDMFVGGVGIFDETGLMWTQVAQISLRKGDNLTVDFSKCVLSVPGSRSFKIGDIL